MAIPYEELLKKNEKLSQIVSKDSWDFNTGTNENTVNTLKKEWTDNIRANVKLFKKHGNISVYKDFGFNKAFVGIGSGPSLKLNIDVLRQVSQADGSREFEDQNFIFAVANHSFKHVLEEGVIPHFVFLCDATGTVMDQLTKDIPPTGQYTTLITALHCNHAVIRRWSRQRRPIRFYMSSTEELLEVYKEFYDENPEPFLVHQGGNVLNTMWSTAINTFHSTVFMATGNDLSYPLANNLEERRSNYYADGREAYNQNIANKRDEAKGGFAWMGFEFADTNILNPNNKERPMVNLMPMGTSHQLWIYKNWIETHIGIHENTTKPIHYYNCSERGILGVMAKSHDPEAMKDKNNWILLDEILPKRWHTRKLITAMHEFLGAKQCLNQNVGILTGARSAGVLGGKTITANGVGQSLIHA